MKINKIDCLKEILRLYKEFGEINTNLIKKHSKISNDTIRRRCGSLSAALIECGIKIKPGQYKNIPKQELDKEILRLYKEFGYVSKPLMAKHSKYNTKVVNRIYSTFSNMYKSLDLKRHPSGYIPTDEELLNDLLRLQKEYGDSFSKKIVSDFGKFSTTCYQDRFGGINKAKKLLNIKINLPGEAVDANLVIEKYSEHLQEKPIYEKTFEWLINPITNCNLRIDAYFESNNIAIEYNGPQHYGIDGRYCVDEDALEYRKYLDKLKADLLFKHGVKLITIHYKDKVDNEYIESTLK